MNIKKRRLSFIILLSLFVCMSCFYIWRYAPFLPHIDRNIDKTFTLNQKTYGEYNEVDFIEKYEHLKRGKKVAIINQTDELPWCTVYEARGANSDDILIVYEEIIMSIDSYYISK